MNAPSIEPYVRLSDSLIKTNNAIEHMCAPLSWDFICRQSSFILLYT